MLETDYWGNSGRGDQLEGICNHQNYLLAKYFLSISCAPWTFLEAQDMIVNKMASWLSGVYF